jgi:hypothetical protein
VGFSYEYTIYTNAMFKGENNRQELIFWVGKNNESVVLLRCNILKSTLEI